MPEKTLFPLIFRLLFLCIILLCPIFLIGCAAPLIKIPKPTPDLVKDQKLYIVQAGVSGMHDTGVHISKDDFVSILANGEIDFWPGHSGNIHEPSGTLLMRIGDKGSAYRYRGPNKSSYTFNAKDTGNIFLGYAAGPIDNYGEPRVPSYYKDDLGRFVVHIIVWQKDDPIRIANFLEEASLSDPSNIVLKEFAGIFKRRREFVLAEQEAEKRVKETEKAIEDLKGKEIPEERELEKKEVLELNEKKLQEEAKQAIEATREKEAIGIKDTQTEKQIEMLIEKLQKASQSLKDLEGLKKQLAEREEKEKELMARLEQVEEGKWMQSKIPPVIAIAGPKDGMSVDFEYISLIGVAEHERGIVQLEILVNQELASQKTFKDLQSVGKDQRRIDFSERIHLREGENEVSVVAQGQDGLATKKTISIQFARKQQQVWAVVIGINRYQNLPSLKYSVNDAQEFYRYLIEVNQVPQNHIWLLLDEEATLDKLRSTLGTRLRSRAGRDDMVIIYLAGHGATETDTTSPDGDGLEKYILPYNADLKDLYASAMPMSEVARIFQRIRSESLVFISDTCYSGASGGRTVPVLGNRASISSAFLDRISQGSGRVILTASDANEVSVEKDELKHGVFTYYLLEGLQGKADLDGDGIITVDEIYRYVSMKVPQATGQDQHPVKKGEMKGQIILGVVK